MSLENLNKLVGKATKKFCPNGEPECLQVFRDPANRLRERANAPQFEKLTKALYDNYRALYKEKKASVPKWPASKDRKNLAKSRARYNFAKHEWPELPPLPSEMIEVVSPLGRKMKVAQGPHPVLQRMDSLQKARQYAKALSFLVKRNDRPSPPLKEEKEKIDALVSNKVKKLNEIVVGHGFDKISAYTGENYKRINPYMRNQKYGTNKRLNVNVNSMLRAMRETPPSKKNIYVFRGMPTAQIGKNNRAFVSTSVSERVARQYASGKPNFSAVKVLVPRGTRFVDTLNTVQGSHAPDEREILLPPGKIVPSANGGHMFVPSNAAAFSVVPSGNNRSSNGNVKNRNSGTNNNYSFDMSNFNAVNGTKLGGSTGARLLKGKKNGSMFVFKKGADPLQAKNEYVANRLYAAAGVPVPAHFYSPGIGLLTAFIDGVTLDKMSNPEDVRRAKAALANDFLIDALLGNWDVMGMALDNILIPYKSGSLDIDHPVRIDNGGALTSRATGSTKDFGVNAVEVNKMRTMNKHKTFSPLEDVALRKQFARLEKSGAFEKILKEADALVKTSLVSPSLRTRLGQRYDSIKKRFA